MSFAKKKSEKPNAELTTMQIFSKALTGGSQWCDKVNSLLTRFTKSAAVTELPTVATGQTVRSGNAKLQARPAVVIQLPSMAAMSSYCANARQTRALGAGP